MFGCSGKAFKAIESAEEWLKNLCSQGVELDVTEANNFNKNQLLEIKQAWQENAIAQSLDASQAGRVYFIPAYLCLGLPGTIGTELYLEELEQQLLPPQQN